MSTIYLPDTAAHAAIRLGGALSRWGADHLARPAEPAPERHRSLRSDPRACERRSAETRYADRQLAAQRLRSFH